MNDTYTVNQGRQTHFRSVATFSHIENSSRGPDWASWQSGFGLMFDASAVDTAVYRRIII